MAQRNTKQRDVVYQAILSLANHPTADEVFARAREALPGISRATVYNNLRQLEDDGLVLRVRFPGEPDRFDRRLERHFHFRCDVCGRVFDYDEPIALATAPVSNEDFDVAGYDVYLHGTCKACRDERLGQMK